MLDMPQVSRQWRRFENDLHEAPIGSDAFIDSPDRREALKLLAASLTFGGVGGCSPTPQYLIPAVHPPPDGAGPISDYATAFVHQGYAAGVLVRHWMGRPIKVEGNPGHPASLGATDAMAQAQLLDFYNPERAWGMTRKGIPVDRQSLDRALTAQRENLAANGGAKLVVLTGASSGPTLSAQLEQLRKSYPEARWLHFEPISRANVAQGAVLAYGRNVEPIYDLAKADVILAIDSDLLDQAPGSLRYARDFAQRRNPARDSNMSRLYAIEATPTLTGAMADHRFISRPSETRNALLALAARLLGRPGPEPPAWLARIADDLAAHRTRALLHLGPDHSAESHALVFAINEALGARGTTLRLIEPVLHPSFDPAYSLASLTSDMDAGRIESLFIFDSNPAFTASALGFEEALKRVDFTLTLTPTRNETSDATLWAVPMAHPWEFWSDARAFDGTASVLQPQSLPLFGGVDPHSLLSLLAQPSAVKSEELVQATWRRKLPGEFDATWQETLSKGVVEGSANATFDGALRPLAASLSLEPPGEGLELLLRPDPFLWDGRNAGNAWLQELPRPLTKIVWDNPALVAPRLAARLGLRDGDMVDITVNGASVQGPVWVHPGQADGCVVLYLGFGRRRGGDVGRAVGVDFFPLYGREGRCALRKLDGRAALASTDHHHPLHDESGQFARSDTLANFLSGKARRPEGEGPFLYRGRPQGPSAWGMSIDLNACIGCSACVVACQAENNIPVVGREQVLREREMHWLRIDRYYEGPPEEPRILFQPVLCMHCEQAPCEPVCPVGATMHDSEGLNVMVYNRCIGTRFCSNNCPYKVRRFNYFAFSDTEPRAIESRNPDVTVRTRGVMEKCTFCIQRIAAARIEADKGDGPEGAVVTACQAACPSQAISFGDIADAESETAQRKKSPLTYALLADQNTAPRVTYEMRILNESPLLKDTGEAQR
jgi:Fe-S-cluster-containing dehydrogenase component